jgi:hypothetical protein
MLTHHNHIVTYRPIARQQLGKDIPAEAYAGNNKTSIARQQISKKSQNSGPIFCVSRAEGL